MKPFEFGIVLKELQSNTSLKDSTIKEIAVHLGIAIPVIIISHFLGQLIFTVFG